MQQNKLPPNLYGFRSSILGVPPERIVILAIFAFVAFLIYRMLPAVAIVLLGAGLLITVYKRGERNVLFKLAEFISWKFSRKSFDISPSFTVVGKDFTFINEKRKTGIVFRLLSSDIYDLSPALSASTYDTVRRILNTINGEMKIFIVPMDKITAEVPVSRDSLGAAEYENLVNGMLARSVYHRVYIAIFGDNGTEDSSQTALEKKAVNIISLLQAGGFSAIRTITEGELQSIYQHSI